MQIEKNISLKPFNTFGVEVNAKYFVTVNNTADLKKILSDKKYENEQLLFLGGGSNLLFTKDFDGLVIKLNNTEIKIISETDSSVLIKADAGVKWDDFVKYTIDKGFSGIENLSLIPGNVGAAPIQNIGAYGVEVKDVIESVNIISLNNFLEIKLSNADCKFGYRNSIFKTELKNNFVVTSVLFTLFKNASPNLEYAPLKSLFADKDEKEITPKYVREAVIKIRESKLPNPDELGNAGSFFKNPIITEEKFNQLKSVHSVLNGYPESDSKIKISAGWLIEQCGLKGKRIGNVGVHEKQALVIVNYGGASGNAIVDFSKLIQAEVFKTFDIKIIPEVNIVE